MEYEYLEGKNMTDKRWQHMMELFQRALDLPPQRRAELLRKACGHDQKLRRAIESLLAADDEADDFLEDPMHSRDERCESQDR